jgi:hypothetical protein
LAELTLDRSRTPRHSLSNVGTPIFGLSISRIRSSPTAGTMIVSNLWR